MAHNDELIRELEKNNLIKKKSNSEIEREYRYKYDSRTQFVFYLDRPFHELEERGSFIPTYLDDEFNEQAEISPMTIMSYLMEGPDGREKIKKLVDEGKITAMLNMLRPYGIKEIARSGMVIISRGR